METQVDFTASLHPNIQVGEVSQPRDPQRCAFVVDAPRPYNGFSVHNNSLNNLLRGLNERVFYTDNNRTEPLRPLNGQFNLLDSVFEDLHVHKVHPWTLAQVRDSYTGSQLTRYSRAYDSLTVEPLSKRDYRVATFVKCEKINFAAKDDPAPRIIQPRTPRFNLEIGKFIKPLEPMLYKFLGDLYQYPAVAKGFDVYQIGDLFNSKWNLFQSPCAIGMDASRFDQHCSKEALQWTHDLYRKYISDPQFDRLLDAMLVNNGYASCKDGKVKYQVEGRRMSGDMDTALGNCVLMVSMVYCLCKTLGIRHEVMDNGDDLCIIMESVDEEKFRAAVPLWFSSLGFKMKVEPSVYILEQIEFCQMHPVFDGSKWRVVRNPICLAKDLVCISGQTMIAPWLKAIGDGGLSLTAGIPVYQAFYAWLQRFGGRSNKVKFSKQYQSSGFFRMAQRVVQGGMQEVTTEARESFSRAFGYQFGLQVALEGMYDSLGKGPLENNYIHSNCLTSFCGQSPIFFSV